MTANQILNSWSEIKMQELKMAPPAKLHLDSSIAFAEFHLTFAMSIFTLQSYQMYFL